MAKTVDDKKIIYSMDRVSRSYGTKTVLKDISISYYYGAKIGVIGANGSGKSSLFKILAGVDTEFTGETSVSPGYTIGYLPQEPVLDDNKTVKEIVEEGVKEVTDLLAEFDAINEAFGESDADIDKLCEKQAAVQEKLDALDAWNLDSRLELAMDALRCPPPDMKIGVLSGGEKRRVALCRLLLQKPDILLLDEPTNHLDAETVAWLERHLQQYEGTVIAVTHDRYFLDNVAGWILELDRGEGYPYKGNYSGWLEQKQAVKDSVISIPAGPRLGNVVIEAQNLTKSFGDKLLFENVNFTVPPGAVVGIVGPNGAGKTTLFKMIVEAAGSGSSSGSNSQNGEKPDSGTIRIGETVKIAYADQMRSGLDPNKTVWEQLSDGLDIIKLGAVDKDGRAVNGALREVNSRAYCSWFNFSGADQQKKVGVLSGGERNRLNLGMMIKTAANVLLLDEPTNDLDVATMRALEEAIERFAGCALIISHDRWFLDRICTHILAFENNSTVRWFEGTWSDYAEQRRKELGADADRPHKTIYRKMER